MQPRKNSDIPQSSPSLFDYLRDLRVIRALAQVIFVIIFVFSCGFLWNSIYTQLVASNTVPSFESLNRRAGFGINAAQSPEWYSSDSTYYEAFFVGVLNTLQVVSAGLVLATVLGVLLGIFLLSQNWLIRTISRIYVEILRNTPLLVQLIFWYFVFWLGLPDTNVSLPNESVMVVALRYFPYLIALIAVGVYVWRVPSAPSRLFSGFLTGFVLLELAFRFLGDGYPIIIGLAVIGAALIVIARRDDIVPSNYEGMAQGIGAMMLIQFVGHVLLDGMGAVGLLENSRFVFGEVVPLLVLGPNLFAFPLITPTASFTLFLIATVIGLIIAVGLYIRWGGIIEKTGRDIPRTVYGLLIIAGFMLVGWIIATSPVSDDTQITIGEGENEQTLALSQVIEEELLEPEELAVYRTAEPLLIQAPTLNRFGTRVQVGNNLSPNYVALLVGLVIYTSAFIGEIVRAGIQAVPYGQIEAARALGLSTAQTLRMIVLPQALRVIIPPMGNQYLNLSKNSSLATAIAFSDTYQVGQTIMNQSGQSITGFALILAVYLTLSLLISLVMNFVNSRFQLVTR